MEKNRKIYMDYAASTPLDEEVFNAMVPYFMDDFANPSSNHFWGQRAQGAVDGARETVASILNVKPEEIIFTGCGTESDNLALRGAALRNRERTGANRILISPVEHHAITETAQQLCKHFGFQLDFLSVDEYGRVDPEEVKASLRPDTAIVSIIFANNEIGSINPIEDIAFICREKDILFHTDAVQAAAHLKIDLKEIPVDLLSIGAHKFYGPKGIGCLFVRGGTDILPIITGGSQEFGLRAGTPNVPYIVGLAEAYKLVVDNFKNRENELQRLRDYAIDNVLANIPRSKITGHPKDRLSNHASFVFENIDANLLLMMLDTAGFACSSGSACKVGESKPSEVLTAIGLSQTWSRGSLRVTLGKNTTQEEVEKLLETLPGLIDCIRKKRY